MEDKVESKAVVIWKKEEEKRELPGSETAAGEDMGTEKKTVVLVVIGAVWAVSPKLEE